jgi:hypothetical protein
LIEPPGLSGAAACERRPYASTPATREAHLEAAMSLSFKKLTILVAVLALAAGCSRQSPLGAGSG